MQTANIKLTSLSNHLIATHTHGDTMKNVFTLTLLLILATGTSFADSIPFNSGTYIGTVSKANDPAGTNATFEALVKTMLDNTSILFPTDLSFDYFTKVDAPASSKTASGNTLSLTYDTKKAGTWTTSSSINLYSVKAGNQYALYWLGLGDFVTGDWSTEDLIVGKKSQPDLSHISAWTVTSSSSTPTPASIPSTVPEPSTMILFGMGLLGASYWSRKK